MLCVTATIRTFLFSHTRTQFAWFSNSGLTRLDFPARRRTTPKASRPPSSPRTAPARRWNAQTASAVRAILAGRPARNLPPLDLTAGTLFQQSTWQALARIPLGKTSTYGKIAAAIRRPKAVRAVGGACGANPIPLLVPCHRVLPQTGGLGGFSGGLDWKRRLLEREGVLPRQARSQS